MPYVPEAHHRRSIRLQGYDYSQTGAYFITITTAQFECSLGEIINGELVLTALGKIAAEWFQLTQDQFHEIEIPYWVVMPNHIHMVVEIMDCRKGTASATSTHRTGEVCSPHTLNAITQDGETPPLPPEIVEGSESAARNDESSIHHPCTGEVSSPHTLNAITQGGETPPLQAQKSLLAKVIAYYKYQTTKQINLFRKSPGTRFWHRNYYDHIIRNETEYAKILLYIEGNPQKWLDDQLHPDAPPNRFNKLK